MTPKRKRRPWTAHDLEVLAREYPHRLTVEVAAILKRSTLACYRQARASGLHKTPEYLASPMSGRTNGKDRRGEAGRFRPGQRPPQQATTCRRERLRANASAAAACGGQRRRASASRAHS